MKKIFYGALITLVLAACSSGKKEEKDLQNEIMDYHNKVMAIDEKAMNNKMKLDTMILMARKSKTDTLAAVKVRNHLDSVMAKMMDWMKNFDPEHKGKSHDEIMSYLQQQKKIIKDVDSLYTDAVKTSDSIIKNKM